MAKLVVYTAADAFGESLKNSAVEYLKAKPGVEVRDLGTDSYYSAAAKVAQRVADGASGDGGVGGSAADGGVDVRGILVCGTGAGVTAVANKFQGVSAVCCGSAEDAKNARSINNANVLGLSGSKTDTKAGESIIDAWLETEFKAPCPANNGATWSDEILSFLDKSGPDIAAFGGAVAADSCPLCSLTSTRTFDPVKEMPGGAWTVVRPSPTTAIVKFSKGSVEPLHHHTFSHDIIVMSGHKLVQNVTHGKAYELHTGDFLSTAAGSLHRVYYFEDTEFFIKFDGKADILLDETVEEGAKALQELIAEKED